MSRTLHTILFVFLCGASVLGAETTEFAVRVISKPDQTGAYWVEYMCTGDVYDTRVDVAGLEFAKVGKPDAERTGVTYRGPKMVFNRSERLLRVLASDENQKMVETWMRRKWAAFNARK